MESSQHIEIIRSRIESEIKSLFFNKKPENLYHPMAYLLESGGKRIRPVLTVLSCGAVGGNIENCIDAAVAVELLHTFTLVHDDMMDHDDLRRGRPTVHKKWDEPTAILAGDGLVTLAYQTLLKADHADDKINILECFTDGLMVLCEGQAFDKAFESTHEVLLSDYKNMIEKKTAKLIEVACEIGAILGNGNNKEIGALKGFADAIGMAFQIQDDLLDVFSEESESGKSLGSDLIEKKKTYLTVYLLNQPSSPAQDKFLYLWKRSINKDDVPKIRACFEESGTRQAAQKEIDNYINIAIQNLKSLKDNIYLYSLKYLVNRIKNRKS